MSDDKPMRKILYSPDYGAGWTSWEERADVRAFMLTYGPFVEAVQSGQVPLGTSEADPIVKEFCEACRERFGTVPYLGALRCMRVMEVSGLVRIEEYDGAEKVTESYDDWM